MITHLYSNQCHDEAEVWCGDPDYSRQDVTVADMSKQVTGSVEETTCRACLGAVRAFGTRADHRSRQLRALAGSCPILVHAADCDCGGGMGDR